MNFFVCFCACLYIFLFILMLSQPVVGRFAFSFIFFQFLFFPFFPFSLPCFSSARSPKDVFALEGFHIFYMLYLNKYMEKYIHQVNSYIDLVFSSFM
ncbi:unnamed protein product [Meloidogyne enterolobii]|uniref:Uncharacterized protein n=1 Tax=Meloidogyne enterolobii TaxID=390850 RepID=A0ACB0Z7F7_MELEN